MYKRVHFIALVPNYYSGSKNYTLYLFDKSEEVVVPMGITDQEALFYLTGQTGRCLSAPSVYDTLKRLVNSLKTRLVSITIYNYQDGIYYTYLNLLHGENHLEINIKFSDAFVLSRLFQAPLYMNYDVLLEKGIKVSKQIIKDALRKEKKST